ncbi:MSCRAMM family protein, partial [Lactobacillus equicursoris]|uniref:MSCRAMM family protein n=1 Tax=Lactobacillus equicursoris TaxID=420645 RepID=UPI0012DEA847
MHNIKWERKMKKFVHQAITFLTVVMTLFPTSLALLLSGGATAKAADSIKIGRNDDGVYYIGDSSDPYYVFCMNVDLHWPNYNGDHDYTEIQPKYTSDYFNTEADYENFKQNESTFWRRLKAILIMGYGNNALDLYKTDSSDAATRVDVSLFNTKLVPTDWLRSDFPTIIGDKVFTYDDTTKKVNYPDEVSAFLKKVKELRDSKEKTASGHTYDDIIATNFYNACQALNYDPLNYWVFKTFFGGTAANETQNAVWELYKEYGFKYNQANPVSLGTLGKEIYEKAKTLDFLEKEPDESAVSITGNTTFAYKNGKWETGTLKIVEPSNYHGQYDLSLPSGVTVESDATETTDSDKTRVAGNTEFKLVSTTQPPDTGTITAKAELLYLKDFHLFEPTNESDKTSYQSMVGAKFGKKTVSVNTSYSTVYDGALKIYKYVKGSDGKADTSKPVRGVKFSVASTTDPSKPQTVATDEKGTATLTGLTPGDYTVTEIDVTDASPKVDLNTTTKKVTVGPDKDQPTEVTFTDELTKGNLEIFKYAKKTSDGKDADASKPIANVGFTITNENGDAVKNSKGETTFYTDKNGKISIGSLTPGKYTVTESDVSKADPKVEEPSDSEKSQEVTITSSTEPAVVTFSDTLSTGSLQVSKYLKNADGSADKSKPVSGVKFKVTNESLHFEETITTGPDGTATLSNLLPGDYTVTETDVTDASPVVKLPTGDDATKTVTVSAHRKSESADPDKVEFTDEAVKGSLEISKYAQDSTGAADTSTPIAGVEFTVTDPDGHSQKFTTNSEGKILLENLTPGEYQVSETSAITSSPIVALPTVDGQVDTTKTVQKIQVKADETGKAPAKAQFSDELVKGNLEISKYAKNYKGEADTSQPIKGVKFTITGPDNYEATTDEKGKINLSGLTPGEYTITESDVSGADPKVEEPDASDKTKTVTVSADKTATASVTFSDKLTTGNLEIVKYVQGADGKPDTSKPVSGVQFTITNTETGKSTTETTNEKGKIELTGLKLGAKYKVEETSVAGASPVVSLPTDESDRVQTFTLDSKDTKQLTFSDSQVKGSLEISKYAQDSTGAANTSKPVSGVGFTITDSNGQAVKTPDSTNIFYTDKSGKLLVKDLLPGKYTVEEVSTVKSSPVVAMPTVNGQVDKSKTVQTVEVKADETGQAPAKAEFSDELVKGNLEISKYAKNYKGEADTSQPIKGVKFTITGPDNYEATTDEKGKINLSGLTPGEYTITESDVSGADPKVEEPEASDKTKTVTVSADKTATASVTFSDKLTTGNLEIVKYVKGTDGKANTSKPVSGVQFTITNTETGTSTTATTDENGKIELTGLKLGAKYKVEETSVAGASPVVSLPADESDRVQTFTLDSSEKKQLTFSDEAVKGNLDITKYAKKDDGTADTSKPIKGVEFTITGPDGYSVTRETGDDGKISLTDLTPGEYQVKETSTIKSSPVVEVPTAAESSQNVTVKAKETASAQFSDKLMKGNLEISKYAKNY